MAKFIKLNDTVGTNLSKTKAEVKRLEAQILTITRKESINALEFVKTLKSKEAVYKKLVLMELRNFRGNMDDWKTKFTELLSKKVEK